MVDMVLSMKNVIIAPIRPAGGSLDGESIN